MMPSRVCAIAAALLAVVTSGQAKTFFTDSDLNIHSRSELLKKVGYPAEIDIANPLQEGGIGASSFWVYYFEAPGGDIRRVSFAFYKDKWLTNEVLDTSLSNKRLRLLSPDSESDIRKIVRYKKIHER